MGDSWEKVALHCERLAEAMQETGKKQVDLVRETGLNKSIISRCLRGFTIPNDKTVTALARALNVSEMWLWGYDVPKERETYQNKELANGELSRKKKDFISKVMQMSEEEIDRLEQILRIVENTK